MARQHAAGGILGAAFILSGMACALAVSFLYMDSISTQAHADTSHQAELTGTDAIEETFEILDIDPIKPALITHDGWSIVLGAPARNQNDAVHEASKFNDTRLVGDHWEWVLAPISVTNTSDAPLNANDLDVTLYVTRQSSSHENMGNNIVHQVLPDEFDAEQIILPGETATGNVGWVFSHEELDTEKEPLYVVTIDGAPDYTGFLELPAPVGK